MYLIGLTGGIASGKSVVAKRLAEHGAVGVDADALAREVVAPGTDGLAAIAREFGVGVLAPDGSLDRPALGSIVFSDPQKRALLNSITHPAVWKRAQQLFDDARRRDPHAVVVYDVPLLVETSENRPITFDLVVVVHASTDERIRRLMELRGMTREEAMHRLNSQASDTERLAIADIVIDSDGTLEETLHQTDELWEMAAASAVSARPD
ncbi:MAG: dephospho-CoA kinase [Rhodoglobus sp.]